MVKFLIIDCAETSKAGYHYSKDNVRLVFEEYMMKGDCFGTLIFPVMYREIPLEEVSHELVDTEWEGDKLYGTIKILGTKKGKLLSESLSMGHPLKLSLHSTAMVNSKKEVDVERVVSTVFTHD